MKPIVLNKYTAAGILLIALAAVFVDIALISLPGEITTAAFVLSAMVCAITGIFTLTFSGGEPVDTRMVGLLPAQGSLTFCRMTNHLGMKGNAYFIPPGMTGEPRVMQFNPVLTYDGKAGAEKGAFREKAPKGLVTTPSCDLLVEDFRKRYALAIRNTRENVAQLIKETIEDGLKVAPKVTYTWNERTFSITFHHYSYLAGCTAIREKLQNCCTMSPCPVCSLSGVLISEGLETVVRLDQCRVSSSSGDVTAEFSILP